ncbi:hypothetical protein KO561_05455 [Radiobacillus kanasensis]|uniref:hypothetical protein n=1 Tax=Radiobacillus kanasensis TaxID=2844358 RepID=UPI001E479FC1|nr:hypothetical protein [Radiobacillus kanasensis]UFU00394.1 hypothetical protein KO561_05455 [Radiobacillus kanasensis]
MNAHICRYCRKEIKNRDQLLTGVSWFRIRPFHYVCFQKLIGDAGVIWNTWRPINTQGGTISALLMLALVIWMAVSDFRGIWGDLLGLVAFYPVLVRVLSFALYERKLPKI